MSATSAERLPCVQNNAGHGGMTACKRLLTEILPVLLDTAWIIHGIDNAGSQNAATVTSRRLRSSWLLW